MKPLGKAELKMMEVELSLVDPNPLEPKERQNPTASSVASLARSIAEDGQLDPAVVIERGGRYEIIAGHRRRKALIVNKAKTILIRIVPPGTDIEQIRKLIRSNIEREPFTAHQEAVLIQEALDLGMSAHDIGVAPERVEAAKRVAKAKPRQLAAVPAATIEEAAALIEFAGDAEATSALEEKVGSGLFDHELERRRQARELADRVGDLKTKLVESGDIVAEKDPWYLPQTIRLGSLGIDVSDHRGCPGHAVWVDPSDASIKYYCTQPHLHGRGTAPGTARPKKSDAERTADRKKRDSRKDQRAASAVRRRRITEILAKPLDLTDPIAIWALDFISRHDGVRLESNNTACGVNVAVLGGEPQTHGMGYFPDGRPPRSPVVSPLNGVAGLAITQFEYQLEYSNDSTGLLAALRDPSEAVSYFEALEKHRYTLSEVEVAFDDLNRKAAGVKLRTAPKPATITARWDPVAQGGQRGRIHVGTQDHRVHLEKHADGYRATIDGEDHGVYEVVSLAEARTIAERSVAQIAGLIPGDAT